MRELSILGLIVSVVLSGAYIASVNQAWQNDEIEYAKSVNAKLEKQAEEASWKWQEGFEQRSTR
jgi:hypothetical protein